MFVRGPARGAVAAGHPLTAQAAAEVLSSGGNAFDGAVAAAFVACVCEPAFASLGGGGLLLARKDGSKPAFYDFFADTPRQRRRHSPPDWIAYPTASGTPLCGGLGSVATPGTVAGLLAIHQDLGWMPLGEVAAKAIDIACTGHPVRALQATALSMISALLTAPGKALSPLTKADPNPAPGQVPRLLTLAEDDVLFNPELGKLIEALTLEGRDLFHKGEVAERLIADSAARGGHLEREDLAFYSVRKRSALSFSYHDSTFYTAPAPSVSGVQMMHTLALLDRKIKASHGWGSDRHWGLLADAIALTHERIDNATSADEGVNEEILMEAKALSDAREILGSPPVVRRGSTHISVVDRKGNFAALTLTNGEGSGCFIPGCGVLLNNFLGTLERGHDEHPWWMGRQRLGSLLAPTLMRAPQGREMVLGAGGSSRIRTALVQTIVNLCDFALSPDKAVERQRLHVLGYGDDATLGAEGDLPDALRSRWPRHRLVPDIDMFFGGVHLAEWNPNGILSAAADPRRDGVALLA